MSLKKQELIPNSIDHLYDKIEVIPNATNDKYQKRNLIKYFKKHFNELNDYRIKIDTGFACNANCYFCYYKTHLNDPFLSFKEIKRQINFAKLMNFRQVEFSGGESSIHPDWFKWLEYAKSMNLLSSTITNGIKFSEYDFIKKSKEKGLNEILFSVHGYKNNHDKMVGVKGAYNKIIKAIEYSNKLNIITRINITLNLLNIDTIYDNIKFLLDNFDIRQVNFIEINNSHEAFDVAVKQHKKNYERIKELYPVFDMIINKIPFEDCLNIRYVPFCIIDPKYHMYNKNYIHHWFDKWDWNPKFIHKIDFNQDNIKVWKTRKLSAFADQLICTRNFWYTKTEECQNCEFKEVCDGYKK